MFGIDNFLGDRAILMPWNVEASIISFHWHQLYLPTYLNKQTKSLDISWYTLKRKS